ncbi:MAG: hypothetical protein ACI841_003145 [Planctomycetota bacterium]|jgi:hypothetical protein
MVALDWLNVSNPSTRKPGSSEGLTLLARMRRPRLHHVLRYSRLRNLVTEQRKFMNDTRRSPCHVLLRHAPNQVDDLHCDWRTSRLRARLPTPVMFEALSMPPDDCGRLNEHECASPLLQHPHNRMPEDAVSFIDVGSVHASLVHGELMSKRNVLEDELAADLGHKLEQVEDQSKVGHARMIFTNG